MFRKKLIACFLALLLLIPAAYAEDTYVPGDISHTLFGDALARGEMVVMDGQLQLAFNENAVNLFGVDAAMLSAISEALSHTSFTLGYGQTDNSIRLLAAGQYAKDNQAVTLDAVLELTPEGLSLTSSVIPGECFSADWNTLFTLAGLGEEELEQILNLSEAGLTATVSQLATEMDGSFDFLAPYGETILAHISALPIETLTDVPAESDFPAAATELNITITDKAIGDLLISLCDQLEADTTLCAVLDAALAESGEAMTTVQLCQNIRTSAQESLTSEENPLYIFVGMDDAGIPLYLSISKADAAGCTSLLNIIAAPGETDAQIKLSFDLLTLSAEDEILDGLCLSLAFPMEQADPKAIDLQLELDLYEAGESLLSAVSTLKNSAATVDALPARTGSFELGLAVPDGDDTVAFGLATESLQSKTADGGEQASLVGSIEISAGEMQIPMNFETYCLTKNAPEAPSATLTSQFKAPLLGIDEYLETYALYTATYTPDENIAELALKTASPEALEALAQRAMQNAANALTVLFELLPPALTGAATL